MARMGSLERKKTSILILNYVTKIKTATKIMINHLVIKYHKI